jgi:hypothetical protein
VTALVVPSSWNLSCPLIQEVSPRRSVRGAEGKGGALEHRYEGGYTVGSISLHQIHHIVEL